MSDSLASKKEDYQQRKWKIPGMVRMSHCGRDSRNDASWRQRVLGYSPQNKGKNCRYCNNGLHFLTTEISRLDSQFNECDVDEIWMGHAATKLCQAPYQPREVDVEPRLTLYGRHFNGEQATSLSPRCSSPNAFFDTNIEDELRY